jgi:hypothetical protein
VGNRDAPLRQAADEAVTQRVQVRALDPGLAECALPCTAQVAMLRLLMDRFMPVDGGVGGEPLESYAGDITQMSTRQLEALAFPTPQSWREVSDSAGWGVWSSGW